MTQIINVRVPSLDEILSSTDETQDNIKDEMQETLKEAEELKKDLEKIDKDLIGGFVIKIGDNQVDASVSRTLNDLRKNFSENPFVKEF